MSERLRVSVGSCRVMRQHHLLSDLLIFLHHLWFWARRVFGFSTCCPSCNTNDVRGTPPQRRVARVSVVVPQGGHSRVAHAIHGLAKLCDFQVGEPRDTVDALHGDAAGDCLHQPPHVLRELDRHALRVGRWLGFGRPLNAAAVRSDIGSRVLRVDSLGVVSFAISCSRFAPVPQ